MYCKHCGKDIGNAAWCPYCGAKQQSDNWNEQANSSNQTSTESQNAWGEQINMSTPTPRTNVFAIVGLILAFFSTLLGLIFSCIGLAKSREYGSGRGIAIAGIIISIINTIFSIIVSIFTVLYWLPQVEQMLLEMGVRM